MILKYEDSDLYDRRNWTFVDGLEKVRIYGAYRIDNESDFEALLDQVMEEWGQYTISLQRRTWREVGLGISEERTFELTWEGEGDGYPFNVYIIRDPEEERQLVISGDFHIMNDEGKTVESFYCDY